jgi:hypothetical protein
LPGFAAAAPAIANEATPAARNSLRMMNSPFETGKTAQKPHRSNA